MLSSGADDEETKPRPHAAHILLEETDSDCRNTAGKSYQEGETM